LLTTLIQSKITVCLPPLDLKKTPIVPAFSIREKIAIEKYQLIGFSLPSFTLSEYHRTSAKT
jgi:hypothetical protein